MPALPFRRSLPSVGRPVLGAMIVALAVSVLAPSSAAEPLPVSAMNGIANCAATTFNPQAPDRGAERYRVWTECQNIVPDDAGGWIGPLASYLDPISSSVYERGEWLVCRPAVNPDGSLAVPLDPAATCAAHLGLNYQNKHYELAVWVHGNRRQLVYSEQPMIGAAGELLPVGQAMWNASPWVQCAGVPEICRTVLAPRKPA